MKTAHILIASCALAALASCGSSSKFDEFELKADKLMKQMTLDEKIGQLSQFVSKNSTVTGPDGEPLDLEQIIKDGGCGSMLSIRVDKQEELLHFQKLAVDSSRLGIPILFGYDYIHGTRTTFPENLGLSCSWSPSLVERTAAVAAAEAAAFGYAWTFSPMCDVAIDPRWGRVSEGSGEDAYLSGLLSAAMVRGYQGSSLADRNTILACVKHFAAYGAAEAGRDYNTVDMSELMFRYRHLPSYKAALDAGALSVMSSFNDFMGVPASGNKWLLTDLLRGELGFRGFVVSDYNAISEMCNHGVAADWKEAAALSLNAGLNMDMVDGAYALHAAELVREGVVSEAQIDDLCRQILAVKYRLGLFDDPFKYGSVERWEKETYLPEYLTLAREAARESMVLLKNAGNVLPIAEEKRIALIGPAGDSRAWTTGAWAGMAESERAVSFLEGLEQRFDHVAFEKGCGDLSDLPGGIGRAVALASRSDVVLMALGLPSNCGGEATSLTSLDLPEAQVRLFNAVAATGKPVVLLLCTGRPMTIAPQAAQAAGVLVTWHAGIEAGNALADVLSGDYNPSGKLTVTFPLELGQVPIHYNAKRTGRPRTNDTKYVSRYLFTPNEPLYVFGEGLSYTTFAYDGLEVLGADGWVADGSASVGLGEDVRVRVRVTNTGSRFGVETAQLYLHDVVASTTRPVRELKAFEKVALKAGESKTVEFVVSAEGRAFCRADMSWGEEPGEFEVFAGGSSAATLSGKFYVGQN